jgi:hypothetical protein
MKALEADTALMGSELGETSLQFDHRVAPPMVESGILTTNLNTLLISRGKTFDVRFENSDESSALPSSSPNGRNVYHCLLRVKVK